MNNGCVASGVLMLALAACTAPEGQVGGACYANGTCNEGIACGPEKKCVVGGIVEGALNFPGSGIPDGLEVCAERTDGWMTCSDQKLHDAKFKYGVGYRLALPPGAYWILARDPAAPEVGAGWYTNAVPCGLLATCRSHLEVLVDVAAGRTATSVDPIDWYTTVTTPVRERWAPVLMARDANQGRLLVSPTTILEVASIMAIVERGMAQPLTAGDVVQLMGGRARGDDAAKAVTGMSEEKKRELSNTTWRNFDVSPRGALDTTALTRALRARQEPVSFDWECVVFDVIVDKGVRSAGEFRVLCSTTTTRDWSYSFKFAGDADSLKPGDRLALSGVHMAIADPGHPMRLCFAGYVQGQVRFQTK